MPHAPALPVAAAERFLTSRTVAVVGASDERGNFGRAVYEAFRDHGYRAYAVNPRCTEVAGDACHPDLASLPEPVDGVVVMVGLDHADEVIDATAAASIPRVWLFKGVGSPGATSPQTVDRAVRLGLDVVPGACPLMFLEPVGMVHRIHRGIRRVRGRASAGQPVS